jgi:glycosyltransferase involved in cell wall biosynthesis
MGSTPTDSGVKRDEVAASARRPSLLVAIYANPDAYPPTINAVRILEREFRIRLVSRNTDQSELSWPAGVENERIGKPLSRHQLARASAISKARDYLNYLTAMRRAIATSRPRLIYAYDPIAFAAAMLARPAMPVIFHCHDLPEVEDLPLGSFQTWLIRYAIKRTRDAAMVVFPEKNRAAYWLQLAYDDRAPLIVPNGAARDFFPIPDLEALAARRFADRLALYYGWIVATHGELNAVRAIGMTAGARLALMGSPEPDFRPVVERTIAENRPDLVEFYPWSAEQKRRLLERAALGLVLYRPASLNLKFLAPAINKLFEYCGAGLPVVVPDQPNYREFLGEEKWVAFANVDDPLSIADAIDSILASRDSYLAMSEAALKAHALRFNYETVFEPVRDRILSLVGASEPRARSESIQNRA